jgi:hypothetical protein
VEAYRGKRETPPRFIAALIPFYIYTQSTKASNLEIQARCLPRFLQHRHACIDGLSTSALESATSAVELMP